MISVERSFYERFPRLAEGRARTFSQPVVQLLRRIACEQRINAILAEAGGLSGFAFVERVLELLTTSYSVIHADRENIPVEGRVVIVANHPLGALDAMTLLHLVGSVRRDVKVLANNVLMQLTPLAPLLLPLPVFGGGREIGGTRGAYRALQRDEAVIVFPSGEVSRLGTRGVRDTGWSSGFARLAIKTGAPVLPVHIAAQNSPTFYGVSLLAKPAASMLLAREVFASARPRIAFQIGGLVPTDALTQTTQQPERIARSMRRHVYLLARRRPAVFRTETAIAHPESQLAVRRALRQAEHLGQTTDGRQILLVDASLESPVLREIGRLREIAFRRVGEGSGGRRDLDRYDAWYRHLVLWDENALAIVGAYRLGDAATIVAQRGLDGLYSASLFDYASESMGFLGEAVELGRSFVQPAYWGSRSLDYLWQGIGAYLRRHPGVRYLFGPVSLSAALPLAAREWIVSYHAHYFGDASRDPDRRRTPLGADVPSLGRHLAKARTPFVISAATAIDAAAAWAGRTRGEGLVILKQRLARSNALLPMLYRQYAELCEPAGVHFLDFGIDPAFGACVDGLVKLDLALLRPAKRARYLGEKPPTTALARKGAMLQKCNRTLLNSG